MPYKSQRHCIVPGCPYYAKDGPYCVTHRKAYEKSIRDPAVRKHYGRRWEKIRAVYLVFTRSFSGIRPSAQCAMHTLGKMPLPDSQKTLVPLCV